MEVETQDKEYHANMAFWHIGNLDMLKIPTMATWVINLPLLMGFKYMDPENFNSFMDYYPTYMGITMTLTMVGILGELVIDEITKRKTNYPNHALSSKNELRTKGAFRIERHPLYFFKTMGVLGASLFSSNPIGLTLGLKGIYHATRGCEEEEKSLKLHFGEEYEKYKKWTPSFVPRSKHLVSLARKIMPGKLEKKLRIEPRINERLEDFNPSIGHLYDN